MSNEPENGVILLISFLVGMLFTGLVVGHVIQRTCDDIWRDQLTKQGVAEYFLDGNNVRQWRMKEGK